MDSPDPEAPPPTRPRRRWTKVALGGLVLLALLLGIAPYAAAPLVRARIEHELERSLAVDATLEELSFGWSGKVLASGLVLRDLSGAEFLHAETVNARISLLAALRGSLSARGEAIGMVVQLTRDESGRWNIEDILREHERERGAGETKEPGGTAEPPELPELALDFVLRASEVHVQDARAGTYTIGPIEATLEMASIDAPAQIELTAPVRTPENETGSLGLDASIAFAHERRFDPEALAGDAKIVWKDLPLDAVAKLGFLPEAIERLAGLAGGTISCRVDRTRVGHPIAIDGDLSVRGLDLAFAPKEVGEEPFLLHEEEVGLELDLGLDAAALDAELVRVHLESTALSGDVQGKLENLGALAEDAAPSAEPARAVAVEGRFTYVPDRIGALLARWIPGKLSGTEPQPLSFTVDGPLVRGDMLTMLSALDVRADLRLATFETAGLRTQGDLGVTEKGGRAAIDGRFDLSGGSVRMIGDLGLVPGASGPSTLSMKVEGAQARGELAPLLAWLHPIFAGLSAANTGALEGTIALDLELAWPGPLPLAELQIGAQGVDWKALSGGGSFALAKAGVQGSTILDQLLELVGKPGQNQLSLQPLAFHIAAGRLAYAKPWTWTLGGAKTTFGGSIGFDRSLDLAWSVPLSEGFLKRQNLPKELAGQVLTLPLSGTLDRPTLEWKGALDELAKGALKDELSQRVDEARKELEEKLGDGLKEKLGGDLGDLLGDQGKDDPEELLRRADALWTEGKPDEARPLYKRLREDYKLSPTYLLNRDRIKERAKE